MRDNILDILLRYDSFNNYFFSRVKQHTKVTMSLINGMEKLTVHEEIAGNDSKLVRKDIKLPNVFEKKLAFVLYDVFSNEVYRICTDDLVCI